MKTFHFWHQSECANLYITDLLTLMSTDFTFGKRLSLVQLLHCVFLQDVALLPDYLLNIISNKYFLAVVLLCAIVPITAAWSSYFFFTAVVCFNESQSRGDSKFIHFQPQNEEVTEALVKSIAISLCPFRLDCGEYLETQSRAGLMTFWLLSTQSYVKWDRRMDPSSQWLAKWLQCLSSTDNTVFESPVRGWRGREWRV